MTRATRCLITVPRYSGTLRADPYFVPETANHYYAEIYRTVKQENITSQALLEKQREMSVAPFLRPHLDGVESILDFGGGAGGRVVDLVDPSRTVALHDVELSHASAGFEAGMVPHTPGTRYDCVVVCHVIEHMLDPAAEMREVIAEYAKPGGLLLVATPIIDRLPADNWLRLFHLAHKFYFSENSLLGLIGSLGGRVFAGNGADANLFRLGDPMPDAEVEACYALGATATEVAITKARRRRLARDLYHRVRFG